MIGIVLTSQTKIFFSFDNFAVDSFVLKISNIGDIENLKFDFWLTLSLIRALEPQDQHVVVQTFAMTMNKMAFDIDLNDKTRQFLEIQKVGISKAFQPHNPYHYSYGHSYGHPFFLCTDSQKYSY